MFRSPEATDAAPLHPGEILRVDILPHLAMTPSRLAHHLGIEASVLHGLLAERIGVTPDLAQRLGRALGHGAHHWLALQMQYDLWQANQMDTAGVLPIAWSRRTPVHRPASAA
ncbi:MAG: HigA family addiction module antitoxin [Hyphomicrobium sp.]|jgi:addiction module HigA family antidote|nr:HigA family addiction module antitoxin [Hyphomicrobium sp.]